MRCIFAEKIKSMIVTQSPSGTYFSSCIPNLIFSITTARALVVMTVDDKQIYSEFLYPLNGNISIEDIGSLVTPYALQRLVLNLEIKVTEQVLNDGIYSDSSITPFSSKIIYSAADIMDISADNWCTSRYLTTLEREKITAIGRLEYLHYIGTDTAKIVASYSDLTTAEFTAVTVQGNNKYTTIDVSPSRFEVAGKELISYDVIAGSRVLTYAIDFDCPDAAPILIFTNSFGVQELIYCTGTHQVAPEFTRDSAYINRLNRNYKITEKRLFKADTGILSLEMAAWADELFRSPEVYIVNIINGSPVVGKMITITESKSENSNDDDATPRFTFSYTYSQYNHNVLMTKRAGRIFDNTFDNTFN